MALRRYVCFFMCQFTLSCSSFVPPSTKTKTSGSGCQTNRFDECLSESDCVWSANTFTCLNKSFTQTGDPKAPFSTFANMQCSSASDQTKTAVSPSGDVYQWTGSFDAPNRCGLYPDAKWDILCGKKGGLKRWFPSAGGLENQNPDKIGATFGNAECECPEGRSGLLCEGCFTDAGCAGDAFSEPSTSPQICKPYEDFKGREMVCNPTHNGAIGGASYFGNDVIIKLLNDFTSGKDRLRFVPDMAGGFTGGLLKPVEHPGREGYLSSAYIFKFNATQASCTWYSGPCSAWVEKEKTGLRAQGLKNPWAIDATCSTLACDEMDVRCPPSGVQYHWYTFCDQFLRPLFTGGIQFVCNDVPVKTSASLKVSTNFTETEFKCVMFVESESIAFLSACHGSGQCVDAPSPSPTPTPSPVPAPPPNPYAERHRYCHEHASWCYRFAYFGMFVLPLLFVAALASIMLAYNSGFLPKRTREVEAVDVDDDRDAKQRLACQPLLSNDGAKGNSWLEVRDIRFFIRNGGGSGSKNSQAAEAPSKSEDELILNDVSFRVGALSCVLGPSGSGKTSLFDIISGRKTLGNIRGDVVLNGQRLSRAERLRRVGYVTQEDVLHHSSTTWEVLAFHAALRMPAAASRGEKSRAVERTLRTLRLDHRGDTRVGSLDHKGLSGGEKRRLSIGIQLLAGCDLLVLDEPLSGLDSSSALCVLEALERVVSDGRHIALVSVHQPSTRLLDKFRDVVLMAPSGRVVYAGARGACIRSLSEGIDLSSAFTGSPAEYMLDLVTAGTPLNDLVLVKIEQTATSSKASDGASVDDFLCDLYVRSRKAIREEEMTSVSPSQPLEQLKGVARSSTQFFVILHRSLLHSLRVPTLFFANVAISLAVGSVVAILFRGMRMDLDGIVSRGGLFFFVLSYFSLQCISALGVIHEDRTLFLHESSSRAYTSSAYFAATYIADLLIHRLVPVLVFTCTAYLPANLRFHPVAIGNFTLVVFVSCTCSAALMSCVALLFRRLATAQLVASMLVLTWMLLAGALLNAQTLGSMRWLLYLSPLSYAWDLLMINEFGRGAVFTLRPRGMDVTVLFTGRELLDQFYIKESDFNAQFYRLLGITLAATAMSYVLLRYHLREKR